VKATNSDSLVMNFSSKENLQKTKIPLDDEDRLNITTKVGNTFAPKITITYVEKQISTKDDVVEEDIVETIVKKSEYLQIMVTYDDDLRIVRIVRMGFTRNRLKYVTF
ncbi:hypothetical protein SK128_012681, partial [Halocaridina rubra]